MAAEEIHAAGVGAIGITVPLPSPRPTVTNALQSTVREPTPDETSRWTTLEHVPRWAKLKRHIAWIPSMAGSLIRLLAGDDDLAHTEIFESASISTSRFEAQLVVWKYSRELRTDVADNLRQLRWTLSLLV